jgi:hypothetical protein
LQGSTESEDVFSWEDDEDDTVSSIPGPQSSSSSETSAPSTLSTTLQSTQAEQPSYTASKPTEMVVDSERPSAPSSQAHTPANTSPRESSEDSYDLISSGNMSASGEEKAPGKRSDDVEDGDSDWE